LSDAVKLVKQTLAADLATNQRLELFVTGRTLQKRLEELALAIAQEQLDLLLV